MLYFFNTVQTSTCKKYIVHIKCKYDDLSRNVLHIDTLVPIALHKIKIYNSKIKLFVPLSSRMYQSIQGFIQFAPLVCICNVNKFFRLHQKICLSNFPFMYAIVTSIVCTNRSNAAAIPRIKRIDEYLITGSLSLRDVLYDVK